MSVRHLFLTAPRALTSRSLLSFSSRPALRFGGQTGQLSAFSTCPKLQIQASLPTQGPPKPRLTPTKLPEPTYTSFDQLATVEGFHPQLVNNLTKYLKLDKMTEVQQHTIERTLANEDVIGQAKTGTGKTLAFLVPLANRILNELPFLSTSRKMVRTQRATPKDTRALIISPTRELAEQIAEEARRLLNGTQVQIQIAVGGTLKRQSLRDMHNRGCHLLVATPGRLRDLISDPASGVNLDKLNSLVLDEADRLLDSGFWPEIEDICRSLPDKKVTPRQTLLFSATMNKEVMQLARRVISPDHAFISTIDPNEEPTHERIPHKLVLTRGFENQMPALLELFKTRLAADDSFKAVVFFNSTAEVSLAHECFNCMGFGRAHPLYPTRLFELHGRLSQAQRTNAANQFRTAKSAILFASDVAARGMDFPAVTDVIQMSPPGQLDTYIHRVGRTGRAGREGLGWLLVPEIELPEMSHLSQIPFKRTNELATSNIDMSKVAEVPGDSASILETVQLAIKDTDDESRRSVYGNILFRLLSNRNDRRNQTVVDALNTLSQHGWGMAAPPRVRASSQYMNVFQRVSGLNTGPMGSFNSQSSGGLQQRYSDRTSQSGGYDRNSRSGGGDRRSGGFDRNSSGRSQQRDGSRRRF